MSFEHSLKRGIQFGFVPHRLQISGRPELNVFPFNVLFMQYGTKDGINVRGSALYEPDLGSLKRSNEVYSMEYHNIYGGINWLIIEYDALTQQYRGIKFINKISVGEAVGVNWNMFFVHFTALGLSNGEGCKFEKLETNAKTN